MIPWQLSKTSFIFGKDSFCWSLLFLVSGLSFWKSVRMFRGSSVESGTGRDQTCRNRSIFAWLKPLNRPVNIRPYTYFLLHWRRESNLTGEENNYTAVSSLLLPHRVFTVSSGVRCLQLSMLVTRSRTTAAHKPSFFHFPAPPPLPPLHPFSNIV